MKNPTPIKKHMLRMLKNMTVTKDVCTTATKFKAFTSWRLLPCNFRTWSRPQFSMPSTCARWLKEQSRWMRVGTSQRPFVLINWLWSTSNCWRFFSDSRPPESSRFKIWWNKKLCHSSTKKKVNCCIFSDVTITITSA